MDAFQEGFRCHICGVLYPDKESAPMDCQTAFEPQQLFMKGERVRYVKRPEEVFIVLEVFCWSHVISYRIKWGNIIIAGVRQEDLTSVSPAEYPQ